MSGIDESLDVVCPAFLHLSLSRGGKSRTKLFSVIRKSPPPKKVNKNKNKEMKDTSFRNSKVQCFNCRSSSSIIDALEKKRLDGVNSPTVKE